MAAPAVGPYPGRILTTPARKSRFHNQFAHAQGGEGSLLRGFQHHRIARGERRPQFPGLHQEREIPGNDLAHHADGFVPGVAEIISRNGNGFALDLVRPTRVVAIAADGQRQVGRLGNMIGLAIVERLEPGQFVGVFLNQIGEPVEQLSAFRGRHPAPWSLFKSRPRGVDSLVHIRRIGFRHGADFLAGRGVDGGKGLPRSTFHPLVVDEKLRRPDGDLRL